MAKPALKCYAIDFDDLDGPPNGPRPPSNGFEATKTFKLPQAKCAKDGANGSNLSANGLYSSLPANTMKNDARISSNGGLNSNLRAGGKYNIGSKIGDKPRNEVKFGSVYDLQGSMDSRKTNYPFKPMNSRSSSYFNIAPTTTSKPLSQPSISPSTSNQSPPSSPGYLFQPIKRLEDVKTDKSPQAIRFSGSDAIVDDENNWKPRWKRDLKVDEREKTIKSLNGKDNTTSQRTLRSLLNDGSSVISKNEKNDDNSGFSTVNRKNMSVSGSKYDKKDVQRLGSLYDMRTAKFSPSISSTNSSMKSSVISKNVENSPTFGQKYSTEAKERSTGSNISQNRPTSIYSPSSVISKNDEKSKFFVQKDDNRLSNHFKNDNGLFNRPTSLYEPSNFSNFGVSSTNSSMDLTGKSSVIAKNGENLSPFSRNTEDRIVKDSKIDNFPSTKPSVIYEPSNLSNFSTLPAKLSMNQRVKDNFNDDSVNSNQDEIKFPKIQSIFNSYQSNAPRENKEEPVGKFTYKPFTSTYKPQLIKDDVFKSRSVEKKEDSEALFTLPKPFTFNDSLSSNSSKKSEKSTFNYQPVSLTSPKAIEHQDLQKRPSFAASSLKEATSIFNMSPLTSLTSYTSKFKPIRKNDSSNSVVGNEDPKKLRSDEEEGKNLMSSSPKTISEKSPNDRQKLIEESTNRLARRKSSCKCGGDRKIHQRWRNENCKHLGDLKQGEDRPKTEENEVNGNENDQKLTSQDEKSLKKPLASDVNQVRSKKIEKEESILPGVELDVDDVEEELKMQEEFDAQEEERY
ncbi:unnamed protein product [Bursaphelenchus xylophilus]|uniref:(pine wood nematode) hypothetical protein n=1 Tax=Bursaphelenchus xylophilus TaxID=6326 RepID=A0A7I8XMQ5_BURXY|nr:unnamed protein product [Bursaphelenchus xylophilus]CAG9090023.1 unnamed protein product [Bursaphelenchus xylophilus]